MVVFYDISAACILASIPGRLNKAPCSSGLESRLLVSMLYYLLPSEWADQSNPVLSIWHVASLPWLPYIALHYMARST